MVDDWIATATDKELVEGLCEVESGLSEWELKFVESVTKQVEEGRPLTQRRGGQRETAEKIMRKMDW